VGLEKLENHEGVAVKALLDSGVTGLFMNMTFAKKKGFKMEKLKKTPLSPECGWNDKCGRSYNVPG